MHRGFGPLGGGWQALGYSIEVVFQLDSMSNPQKIFTDIENRIDEINERWDILDIALGNIVKEMNRLETERFILEECRDQYKRCIVDKE